MSDPTGNRKGHFILTLMKKQGIFLSLAFAAAISSCQQQDNWIDGRQANGRYRDTVRNGSSYRYYNGMWYPIYHNQISPSSYNGASASDISRPGFAPSRVSTFHGSSGVRTGGFGSSFHSSFGS